jgi:hypothetical protein
MRPQDRFVDRLIEFDYSEAMLYLAGDRMARPPASSRSLLVSYDPSP